MGALSNEVNSMLNEKNEHSDQSTNEIRKKIDTINAKLLYGHKEAIGGDS